MAIYAYGVVPRAAGLPARLTGVGAGRPPIRLVEEGPIAAVVSDLDESGELDSRDVVTHKRVVEAIFKRSPIIPFRFAMVSPDEATLRRELRRSARAHAAGLRSLRNRVEYGVTATFDEEAMLRTILSERREIRELSAASRSGSDLPQLVGLGEAVATEVDRRRRIEGRQLVRRLKPLAVGYDERPARQDTVLRGSFLLERGHVRRFRGAVARLNREHGGTLQLECVGPLPPYSFASSRQRPPGAG